jgi:hypothetical protein
MQQDIQEIVDTAPKAKQYFSDAFEACDRLWYHYGPYEVSEGKTDSSRLKAITPSCDIIWRVWQDRRVVSRAVHVPWNALCACSYSGTKGDNCTNNCTLPIQLTSRIALTHYFSHAPFFRPEAI